MWVEAGSLVAVNVSRKWRLFSGRTVYDLKPLQLSGRLQNFAPQSIYALAMDAAAIRPRNLFVASARLKDDKIAIYTEEGTPIQNLEVRLDLIIEQLVGNGATRTNAERFFDDLNRQGFAELRQTITLTSFSVT